MTSYPSAEAEILIVEDEDVQRRALETALTRQDGYTVRSTASAEAALAQLEAKRADLVITDHRLPGDGGHALLQKVKRDYPDTAVIVVTGNASVEDAVLAMRDGAFDYLQKPVDLHEVAARVDHCLQQRKLRREIDEYRRRDMAAAGIQELVGSSWPMRKLRALLQHIAGLEKQDGGGLTILITGEPGSGRRTVARALHRASARSDFPFLEISCDGTPEALLEAELIGCESSAVGGVDVPQPGLLETAGGGTVFLANVDKLPPKLQVKLLRAIDERCISRRGGTRKRAVHAAIVAASSCDLEAEVQAGRFREDLYHRLNVLRVDVPALRERDSDVVQLAHHFMKRHAQEYGLDSVTLSKSALQAIAAHEWPGNVRELDWTMERALVLTGRSTIDAYDLGLWVDPSSRGPVHLVAPRIDADFNVGPIPLEQVERKLIREAIAHSGNHTTVAARLLGVSRHTLLYRLRKHEMR